MGRIVDSDRVTVVSVSRKNQTNIEVSFDWRDSAGNLLGRFGASWPDVPALKSFLEEQGFDDVLRAFMGLMYNAANESLRGPAFDASVGKTYEVRTRVVELP
jgi:hypothetical protein